MKHKIKIVYAAEVMCTPKIEGYEMITCSEEYIFETLFEKYEYVPNEVNLCDGWTRDGDYVIKDDIFKAGAKYYATKTDAVVIMSDLTPDDDTFSGVVLSQGNSDYKVGHHSTSWDKDAFKLVTLCE